MKIELEMYHLILMLIAFFGCVAAFGKVLLDQFEKRFGERFEEQSRLLDGYARALANMEREFLTWKGELPLHYVRREDYVRNQTVIEAKLDGLALRIENVQLKGALK